MLVASPTIVARPVDTPTRRNTATVAMPATPNETVASHSPASPTGSRRYAVTPATSGAATRNQSGSRTYRAGLSHEQRDRRNAPLGRTVDQAAPALERDLTLGRGF